MEKEALAPGVLQVPLLDGQGKGHPYITGAQMVIDGGKTAHAG